MKIKLLLFVIAQFCLPATLWSQTIQHTYRFNGDLMVAQPECGPILAQAKSPGGCAATDSAGKFIEDVLACGVERSVYHNSMNWGLVYPNTEGAVTNNYTIQLYIKVTNWGKMWARIIDFSNGRRDEGVYFKTEPGTEDHCLNFYPSGIAGACPFFNSNTYYLLTFTRNAQTGMVDVYVNDTLFTSYDDSEGRYVGKAGTPIYIFRDDDQKICESGEANFAYLSFSNKYFSKADVDRTYQDICFVANTNAYADFSISPNPVCNAQQQVTVTYTGIIPRPGSGYTFKWDWDGAQVISGSGMGPYVISWKTGGTKNVALTVINDACGNSKYNRKQATVSTLELETEILSGDCVMGEIPTVKLQGTEGVGPYEYSLDAVKYGPDSVFKMPFGTYKVYVKDQNGCIVAKDLNVEYNGDIQVGIGADSIVCFGESLTLNATGNGQKFMWTPAESLDDPTAQSPTASPEQTTEYIVKATKGSCSATAAYTVHVAPKVEVIVTPDSLIKTSVPIQLSATSPQVPDPSEAIYVWSPPEGLSDPSSSHPIAVLQEDQTYSVEVTAANGCKGGASVTLTIEKQENIFVPTAFTPNGDGKNERLYPILSGINSINYYRIYNRWGELVFYTTQLEDGWDGHFKGESPVIGTYVWEIEGVSYKGRTIRKRGSVTLIR